MKVCVIEHSLQNKPSSCIMLVNWFLNHFHSIPYIIPFLLVNIGEAKIGTDEDTFVEIIGRASQRQAYLIFEEYKKVSGKTIIQAMQSEMSGELLSGLMAIGKVL